MKKYDVIVSAHITLGGEYEANSMEEAIANAKMELRQQGELENVEVERAVYLDDEPLESPDDARWYQELDEQTRQRTEP